MQEFQFRDCSNLTQKRAAETDWMAKQGWTDLTTITAHPAEMQPNYNVVAQQLRNKGLGKRLQIWGIQLRWQIWGILSKYE